jgi:hypothetical protein
MIQFPKETEDQLQWIKDNPSFCPLPFTNLFNHVGEIGPCCYWRSTNKPKFTENVWLGKQFTELRTDIVNGQKHKGCAHCYQTEEWGATSDRIMYSQIRLNGPDKDYVKDVVTNYPNKELKIKEILLQFSNLCNLSCRSCFPWDSSLYAKMTNTVEGPLTNYTVDRSDIPKEWQFILNSLSDGIQLQLMGGETMIQPGLERLLDYMIEKEYFNINIILTTNGTSYIKRIVDKLELFNTHIFLSIDSVDQNYEYLRWPAKFSKIETNLDCFFQHTDIEYTVTFVTYLNNIFYINDILDYWHQTSTAKDWPSIGFSPVLLMNKEFYEIKILPNLYKQNLKTYINNITKHPILDNKKIRIEQHAKNNMSNFIEFCNSDIENLDMFRAYLKETAEWDVRTKQDASVFNSRLWNCLSESDKNYYHACKINFKSKI